MHSSTGTPHLTEAAARSISRAEAPAFRTGKNSPAVDIDPPVICIPNPACEPEPLLFDPAETSNSSAIKCRCCPLISLDPSRRDLKPQDSYHFHQYSKISLGSKTPRCKNAFQILRFHDLHSPFDSHQSINAPPLAPNNCRKERLFRVVCRYSSVSSSVHCFAVLLASILQYAESHVESLDMSRIDKDYQTSQRRYRSLSHTIPMHHQCQCTHNLTRLTIPTLRNIFLRPNPLNGMPHHLLPAILLSWSSLCFEQLLPGSHKTYEPSIQMYSTCATQRFPQPNLVPVNPNSSRSTHKEAHL